jgi:hypothetical protein
MATATRNNKKSARRRQLEAAINYPIDWLEERSGLVGGIKYFLFRKVPGDTNWFHTLGSANWIIGVMLLAVGMLEGFTGYLLPWDQTAYWATVVGINLNGTAPFLGPFLADFLRGGAEIGNETLSRFYSMHMLLIPGLIFALIGLHLYLVIRLGVSSPPWSSEAAGSDYDADEPTTNGRTGLTQPSARSGWRRNGGETP